MDFLKDMSTWVIISWVVVVLLTAINVLVFLKLKNASEQMLKMAFPGAKDMNQALAQMQQMMGAVGGGRPAGGKGGRGKFLGPRPHIPKNKEAQLQNAMQMLQQLQQKKK